LNPTYQAEKYRGRRMSKDETPPYIVIEPNGIRFEASMTGN